MCNNFIKAVRESAENSKDKSKKKSKAAQESENKSEVKLPNQIGFEIADWSNYFKASNSLRTSLDGCLYKTGLWFYIHAQSIQKRTEEVFNNIFSTGENENLLRLVVGMVNFRASKMSPFNYTTQNLNQLLIPEASELEGIVEGFITAARYPIAEVIDRLRKLPCRTNITNNSSPNLHNLLELLDSTIDFGISYDSLEYIWNKCLWNDWYIDVTQNPRLVKPVDSKREKIYKINLQRWKTIFQFAFIQEWSSCSDEERRVILRLPRISANLVNDCKEISLSIHDPLLNFQEALPSPPMQAITLFLKQDFYPESLRDEPLPKILNLTLHELLLAWHLIATIASDVKSQLPKIEGKPTQDDLLRFSPVFSRTALLGLLTRVYPWLSAERASRIIKLLTFRNRRDDLWHRPLIKINDDRFTAIFMALDSPNLSRPVSGWMEEGGLKIDKKGNEFQKVAYEKLCKHNQLSNVKIYPSIKNFSVSEGEEEIDLVLRVGKTIIVCELKCTLFPSEPYQIHKYYQELEHAAEQAKRKLDFVRNNLEDFFNKVNFSSTSIEDFKVIPLVISNLPLATGYSFQNIPIVDLRILEDYLTDGKFTLYSQNTEQGWQPLRQQQVYSSEEEAEERIEGCLRDLPHIKEYCQNIRWIEAPIGNQEKPIAFQMRAMVQLPQDFYQP